MSKDELLALVRSASTAATALNVPSFYDALKAAGIGPADRKRVKTGLLSFDAMMAEAVRLIEGKK